MTPLNRKLYRDLWRLRGQVLAIALVIASGIAVLAMSLTSMEALTETAIAYYERYRFGDVFASVERAPEYLADRIRKLPGVQAVDTRVVKSAVLDMEGFEEPVIGHLVSVPERRPPDLNQLALRSGRVPRLRHPDEAVLAEPFAEAHGLTLGGTFRAVLNGNWRKLTVVGIALSPEFVYTIGPGRADARRPALRHRLAGPGGHAGGLRPGRRVQRPLPHAPARRRSRTWSSSGWTTCSAGTAASAPTPARTRCPTGS